MAQVVRRRASPQVLASLAELVDGGTIMDLVEALHRAKVDSKCGHVGLELELSFGNATDGYVTTRLRPRREVA